MRIRSRLLRGIVSIADWIVVKSPEPSAATVNALAKPGSAALAGIQIITSNNNEALCANVRRDMNGPFVLDAEAVSTQRRIKSAQMALEMICKDLGIRILVRVQQLPNRRS